MCRILTTREARGVPNPLISRTSTSAQRRGRGNATANRPSTRPCLPPGDPAGPRSRSPDPRQERDRRRTPGPGARAATSAARRRRSALALRRVLELGRRCTGRRGGLRGTRETRTRVGKLTGSVPSTAKLTTVPRGPTLHQREGRAPDLRPRRGSRRTSGRPGSSQLEHRVGAELAEPGRPAGHGGHVAPPRAWRAGSRTGPGRRWPP